MIETPCSRAKGCHYIRLPLIVVTITNRFSRVYLQDANDESLDARGRVDVLGNDEADGDAERGGQSHEHDVEHLEGNTICK